MPKRILMIAPYARWTPHHETELELAENHLRAGDEVTWLECQRDLPFCEPNPQHELGRCLMCSARGSHGRSLLSAPVNVVRLPQAPEAERAAMAKRIEEARDIDRLRELVIGAHDAGLGIASSLISVTENSSPDLADARLRELAGRIAQAGLQMFHGVRRLLVEQRFDQVYVLNGRFAAPRAAMRAARELGIPCVVHERGSGPDKYVLRQNAMAHDLGQLRAEVEELWVRAGETEGTRSAQRAFEQMRGGVPMGWHSYIGRQRPDELPQGWDSAARNIVFFASSEDEFKALEDEWLRAVFPSQVEGILRLRQLLVSQRPVKFWVRMHPNQERMPAPLLDAFFALDKEAGIEVIAPASPVSSYALIDAADCVVTFGSTIGIEAAFWGRPSVLLAQAVYRGLGSTYDADTAAEALAWISDPDLPPRPKLGAMKYGNFLLTFGRPFVHFQNRGLSAGTFRGQRVRAGVVRRVRLALSWALARLTGRAGRER